MLSEPGGHFTERKRPAEQVALRGDTTDLAEQINAFIPSVGSPTNRIRIVRSGDHIEWSSRDIGHIAIKVFRDKRKIGRAESDVR